MKGFVVIGVSNSLKSCSVDGTLPNTQLRFAVVSDGHYGQPRTAYETYHDEMITWINEEHKNQRLDFTFINGDLFHDDAAFLPAVKQKWDTLAMPYYVSHGNHDTTDEATWQHIWSTPWNFSFEKYNSAFLVLNTSDAEGNNISPDLEWTKKQLLYYQDMKHLFVFMHITPFNWTLGGAPCPELVELFEAQKNLKAIFHGHDHDEDYVKQHSGQYYFFDSHIGSNWGTNYRGYRIVEIAGKGDVITYQINPSEHEQVNSERF